MNQVCEHNIEVYTRCPDCKVYSRDELLGIINNKNQELKQLVKEARDMFRDFQSQTVPSSDWIYEMNATIDEWLEKTAKFKTENTRE